MHASLAGILEKRSRIIEGTALHMGDYVVFDSKTGIYHLDPVMPPSEQGIIWDAVFDLAYWRWGLTQAQTWKKRMGREFVPEGPVPIFRVTVDCSTLLP